MLTPLDNWRSDWTLKTFHTGMYMGNIRGRTMQKCADDLDRYNEIINDTQPDVVIETGTRYGGSALWFRDRVDMVVSVDFAPPMTPQMVAEHPTNTWFVKGDSKDPKIIAQVKELVAGKRVMVSLDSDHHANHVWQEITLYGAMVSKGCFLVVEDACFDMWTGEDSRRGGRRIPEEGGPLKAMQLAGLDTDPRWKRDAEIEGWTEISHSPCGWWERVG
jgi:cephalosporin hydroxylase